MEAFRPLDKGETGLSVFRERFVSADDVLLAMPEDKRARYAVAWLRVADLRTLGLTVIPDPIDTVAGHALLPELNTESYHLNKSYWKGIMKRLAELAARDIVIRPNNES